MPLSDAGTLLIESENGSSEFSRGGFAETVGWFKSEKTKKNNKMKPNTCRSVYQQSQPKGPKFGKVRCACASEV